jgi:hypothetical protein
MPQKPQVRAKEKRRLTKRLAAWRAKQEGAPAAAEKKAKPASKPAASKPAAAKPAAKKKAEPKASAK